MHDKSLLVLNGPGLAEAHAFGAEHAGIKLEDVRQACVELCQSLSLNIEFRQTNQTQILVDWLKRDSNAYDAIVISPIARVYATREDMPTYLSLIAQLITRTKPIIEVHVENIFREHAREIAPLRTTHGHVGLITGLGINSYLLAIQAIAASLTNEASK